MEVFCSKRLIHYQRASPNCQRISAITPKDHRLAGTTSVYDISLIRWQRPCTISLIIVKRISGTT